MTPSVTWALVRSGHLVRGLRRAPFATVVAACAVFLVARRGDTHDAIGDLRVVALLLAVGSGYVLDDSAATTLRASPYGLARRLWLRIGCAAAVVIPLWTAVLVYYLPTAAIGAGVTVELAAALAVTWAVAASGRRHGVEHPGIVTTPALLTALALAASIPRAPMLVGPGAQWTSAHLRWAGVLVAATCVLVAAMRDPAARGLRSVLLGVGLRGQGAADGDPRLEPRRHV